MAILAFLVGLLFGLGVHLRINIGHRAYDTVLAEFAPRLITRMDRFAYLAAKYGPNEHVEAELEMAGEVSAMFQHINEVRQ